MRELEKALGTALGDQGDISDAGSVASPKEDVKLDID